MKKVLVLIFGLFSFVFARPVNADALLRIRADVLGTSVNSHFSTEDGRIAVVSAVQKGLKASPNGLSVRDVWAACVVGGLDIAAPSGKAQCESFLRSLATFADDNYIRVCTADELNKISDESIRKISKCENDFFVKTGSNSSCTETLTLEIPFSNIIYVLPSCTRNVLSQYPHIVCAYPATICSYIS